MEREKLHFYSIFSGEIYQIWSDHVQSLDEGQFKLNSLPKKSCKCCYGRLFESIDKKTGFYNICRKCGPVCVDQAHLEKQIQSVQLK